MGFVIERGASSSSSVIPSVLCHPERSRGISQRPAPGNSVEAVLVQAVLTVTPRTLPVTGDRQPPPRARRTMDPYPSSCSRPEVPMITLIFSLVDHIIPAVLNLVLGI